MAYKLAIDDIVGVKVEGKNVGMDGTEKPFKFILQCQRKNAQAMRDVLADHDETAGAFIEKNAVGWQKQTMVLDEEGQPAAFSAEALRALLGISGMAMLCWQSYLQQVQATAKN